MWRSHFNSECQTTCSGMLETKAIIDIFRHNSFYFLSFQNLRQMYCGGQEDGRQGGGSQREGGVGHIGAGIILSASCLLTFGVILFYG